MKRMGGWLGSKAGSSSSKSLTALDEPHALQEAMASAVKIINDEVEEAEMELSQGTSPFHKLGRATALFLRATLGFEKEIMEQASVRLAEAEESASEHQRRAVREPSTAHHSAIYPVGSEYALCHAESQLMSAVVAVLNESLTESLRGFYKLRKAFTTLHEISEAERRYVQSRSKDDLSSRSSALSSGRPSYEQATSRKEKDLDLSHGDHSNEDDEDEDDFDFVDAEEGTPSSVAAKEYQGHLEMPDLKGLSLLNGYAKTSNTTTTAKPAATPNSAADQADNEVDFRTITSDPIDLFVHSGTALCFGLLQLLLSMVPPAFSKLLSLFSFRGNREAGLRMLWSATRFKHDVNGAMAGLITLGFHNAAIGLCDILARDALPEARLKALLTEMRQLYPKSKLWLLEEGRMLAADQHLEQAIQVIGQGGTSPLKQVEALRMFERSLYHMYLHHYEDCAECFVKCVDMNSWSHGLYYYIAGVCYVEQYRACKDTDPERAERCAVKAEEYLHIVPQHTGKKRFMARPIPFDTFVLRKIAKWDNRAKAWNCRFVDAVGVSPVIEMIYFWSGSKRMAPAQLRTSLERLAWFQDASRNPHWHQEAIDEKAMLSFLKGVCYRFLGDLPAAKAMLTENVINCDLAQLKACDHPDTWPMPVAHYEMAVCLWQEAGGEGGDRATLQKCSEEIARVEKWETFDLEARVGLKVTTARDTLRRCGIAA